MIAALTGKVLSKGTDRVIVDVSGVGYEVFSTTDTLARIPDRGEEIFLHIHTHVREDAIVLFGFLEEDDKGMYLTLTSVSGVGPKLGLAILSGMNVADLCRSIAAKDIKRLTGLQGVGKKTAERICVDLKDKIGQFGPAGDGEFIDESGVQTPATSSAVMDALSALSNLGYPDPVCRRALASVKNRCGEKTFYELSVEELLRECLRSLA